MLELIGKAAGTIIRPMQAYLDDSNEYWPHIDRFDKLERLQHFREPNDAGWQLFAAGWWEESLAQAERERPLVEAEFAEDVRLGYASCRVRVAEFPITPYLQWEMHQFRIRVECGEHVRVVQKEAVSRHEADVVVPELIFMDSLAMYGVFHDETRVLSGGRKFTDADLIAGCRAEVQALYAEGEDFWTLFEREIVPLPPPAVDPG